ncbi:MAG: hypothetical protein BWZ00_00100 [Bacteroidetes bacterium ADurb.BinA174]|nr:MAG: hypothetical protein BWZ00_00100 [Bacteroidetes bacterium ADurb.BinA174]
MKRSIFILLGLLLLINSCEYNKDEIYYSDVQKPEGEITLNLTDFPSDLKIYIYKRTRIFYDLQLPEGDILKKKFSLGGREIFPNDDNFILLEPEKDIEYSEMLVVDVEVDPKSESIAGKLGLENYIGKFQYEIIFLPNVELHLQNISHRKTNEGYFELVWSKPELEQYTVDKYRITYYFNNKEYIKEITDPNITNFVDSNAVFGYLQYKIETYFKEPIRESWIDYYTTKVEFPKNSVKFEYTGVNSGKISWPQNEYKSKYALALGYYGDIIYEGENNFFEIDNLSEFSKNKFYFFPLFGHGGEWIEIYVVPFGTKEIERNMPIHFDTLFSEGIILGQGDKHISSDVSKKIIFVKAGNKFSLYNSNNLSLIYEKTITTINPESWNERVFCSEKSSKFFLTNEKWIDLVSYDLQNHEKITFSTNEKLNYVFAHLGTNDIVFIRPVVDIIPEGEPEVEGKLYAYELRTKELKGTLSFSNKWDETVISRDGKYVAVYNDTRILVHEYNQGNFTLIHRIDFPSLDGGYEKIRAYFNEKNTSQLIITQSPGMYNNEMYVVNLLNGLESSKIRTSYVCSDPFTGNIITNHGSECIMFDPLFTSELFRHTTTDVRHIFNNYFFTFGWGDIPKLYYLEITNYLKK